MVKNKRSSFRYWLPVMIWAVFITGLSSVSSFPKETQPLFAFDKLWHFIEYAVFSFLILRSLRSDRATVRLSQRFSAVGLAGFYAVFDEVYQYFIPSRCADWQDLTVDVLGAVVGVMLIKSRTSD